MALYGDKLRDTLKLALAKTGLLPTAQWILRTKPVSRYRYRRPYHRRFREFRRQYGHLFQDSLNGAGRQKKTALVCSVHFPEVELELGLIKALELAGFKIVVLIEREGWLLEKYYKMAAIKEIHLWSEFTDPPDFTLAEAAIGRFRSTQELMAFEYDGARVGTFAISTALRQLKLASLNLQSPRDRQILVKYVASGMAYAKAAQRILRKFRPELAVFVDIGYTPKGELFDHCLANGIDAIAYDLAHKNSTLMLKRYTLGNREHHTSSLSRESWQLVRNMKWTAALLEELHRELCNSYTSGDWYSVCGTQFNKHLRDVDQIRRLLGLEPMKKTAFIFPHVLWDASLFYGKCLFRDYEEWLVETVRAACSNDQVNWVIKIHPAHVGKSLRERFQTEPAELTALRQHIGELPPHIFMLPAESDISTLSLFELMDWCLTVRGTIGIEASRLGIPVLTAGTGRYDRKGFTIDSDSREQYLERVARIQNIPRLSPEQQELAERFAYSIFLLRPLPLTTATLKYQYPQDHGRDSRIGFSEGQINIRNKKDWHSAPDLRAFAQWVNDTEKPDFLMKLPETEDRSLS